MPLRVTARRRISSSAAGSGRVPAPPRVPRAAASRVRVSTGRSADPTSHRLSSAAPATSTRHTTTIAFLRPRRCADVRDRSGHEDGLRAVRSRPDADRAQHLADAQPAGRRARRAAPSRARGEPPGSKTGPAGHPPSEPRHKPGRGAVEDLDDGGPAAGHRHPGNRPAVTRAATPRAWSQAAASCWPREREPQYPDQPERAERQRDRRRRLVGGGAAGRARTNRSRRRPLPVHLVAISSESRGAVTRRAGNPPHARSAATAPNGWSILRRR